MNRVKRIAEFRATLKGLEEQRAELQEELQDILDRAKVETRAFTKEEQEKFDEIEGKINSIDATISAEERARSIDKKKPVTNETNEEKELRAFANFVRKKSGLQIESRAGEQNLTMGNNGAVIPVTIANRIIKAVKDICPIYAKATMYNVKGTLKVPVWGKANTTHDITVAYQQEFVDITADSGAFSSVDLTGFLAGALTLIGKSVINNSDVDVVNFIVSQMATEIAAFLEKELLVGTAGKATGALSTTTTLTSASATAITADELVDLQAKIKQVYQTNACWIMNPSTFTAVKKLKDNNGRYLLQDDYTSEFPYRLLGKPVYLSDNMPSIAAGSKAILYGDLSGLSVNMREDVQIQILLEKYSTQHAIGIVSWFEFDSKVTDNQKLATLAMKTA